MCFIFFWKKIMYINKKKVWYRDKECKDVFALFFSKTPRQINKL